MSSVRTVGTCPDAYGLLCAYRAQSVGALAAHLVMSHRWPAWKAFDKAREIFRR